MNCFEQGGVNGRQSGCGLESVSKFATCGKSGLPNRRRTVELTSGRILDLPLASQFSTASRLKVSSNLRRHLTDDVLMDLIIHDFLRFSVRQIEAITELPAQFRYLGNLRERERE